MAISSFVSTAYVLYWFFTSPTRYLLATLAIEDAGSGGFESSVPNSALFTVDWKKHRYLVAIWSVRPDRKVLIGMAWRHRNHLITASHVVDAIRMEVNQANQVVFESSIGNVCSVEVTWETFQEDVAICLLPHSLQGVQSAEVTPVNSRGEIATIVSAYPADNSSTARVCMADEFGYVKYFGTTRKGFSGAPYVVNGKVVGMHTLGSVGFQFGVAASYIKDTYMRKEDSEDIVWKQIMDQYDEEQALRIVGAGDEVQLRLKNGRYVTVDYDEWRERMWEENRVINNAIMDSIEEMWETYEQESGVTKPKPRKSSPKMIAKLLAKCVKENGPETSENSKAPAPPVGPALPAPEPKPLPQNLPPLKKPLPPPANLPSTPMAPIPGSDWPAADPTQCLILDMLQGLTQTCSLLQSRLDGLQEQLNRSSKVSESTRSDVKTLTKALTASGTVTSANLQSAKKTVNVDTLNRELKKKFASFATDFMRDVGSLECGIPEEILFDTQPHPSTSTDQPLIGLSDHSTKQEQQVLELSNHIQQLAKHLATMESRLAENASSSSESSSESDSNASPERKTRPKNRRRRKAKAGQKKKPAKADPKTSSS